MKEELWVIAAKRSDGGVPSFAKVLGDNKGNYAIYHSKEEAEYFLKGIRKYKEFYQVFKLICEVQKIE